MRVRLEPCEPAGLREVRPPVVHEVIASDGPVDRHRREVVQQERMDHPVPGGDRRRQRVHGLVSGSDVDRAGHPRIVRWEAVEPPVGDVLARAARRFGTPCYVYDLARLDADAARVAAAFPSSWLRLYSLKAN